jgi:hypothetical protein
MSRSWLISPKSFWNRSVAYKLQETTLFGHSYGIWLTGNNLRGRFLCRANFFFAFPFDKHILIFTSLSMDKILFYIVFEPRRCFATLLVFSVKYGQDSFQSSYAFFCCLWVVTGAKKSLDRIPSMIVGTTRWGIMCGPFQHVWDWIRHWTI